MLKRTVLEFCYKNDDLGDPMVNEYHIYAMDLAIPDEIKPFPKWPLRLTIYYGII